MNNAIEPSNPNQTMDRNSRFAKSSTMLKDHEKATLFLYLTQVGLPPWAETEKEKQILALAAITGWTKERAQSELDRSIACGYALKA